jgi:hypothetical protein
MGEDSHHFNFSGFHGFIITRGYLVSATTLDKPSILVILRRQYLEITNNFCAAKLIEYFKHWTEWKLKTHRTPWVYQTLKRIHADLMGEHSLHVIRQAIALLENLGLIEKRNNEANGQDKTYQYKLDLDLLSKLLSEHRECDSEVPECKNELSEFTVEQHHNTTSQDSTLSSDPQTANQEKEEGNNFPEVEKSEDTTLQPDLSQYTVPPQNSQGDKIPPRRVVEKPKLKNEQTKEVWEVVPGEPYEVFINWRAEKKYKPQGGAWAADARTIAIREFYKDRQITNDIFRQFLNEVGIVADNCNQLQSAEIMAMLPSYFIALPEATEENVQQLMTNLRQLVARGVGVALPQGIATSSCRQNVSYEAATNTELKALPTLSKPALPSAPSHDLQRQLEHALKMWENPRQQPQVRAWVKRTPGVKLGENGPELDYERSAPCTKVTGLHAPNFS